MAWQVVATLDKFAIFHLNFPEEYILKTIIPATNEEIKDGELTLNEFYTWLGCRFFIACYITEFETRAVQKADFDVGRSSPSAL